MLPNFPDTRPDVSNFLQEIRRNGHNLIVRGNNLLLTPKSLFDLLINSSNLFLDLQASRIQSTCMVTARMIVSDNNVGGLESHDGSFI